MGAISDSRAAPGRTARPQADFEEQYRLLVEGVKDYAIFMLDPEGHVRTWNPGAERIKGYTAEEIIGKHLATFYPPEGVALGLPEEELRTATETGKYEEEGWRVRKDGTQFWAGVVLTALRDDSGNLHGFAKVTRDLTERRRLEQDLIEQNAALERAIRTKDRFLASMSHELRTPLNAVLGYSGTLLMGLPGPLNAEQEKQLRTVQLGARHLLSLINDLLDLAKIDSGTVDLKAEPIACRELLEDVARTIRPLASARGLELAVGPVADDLTASLDRRAVSQVLLNLATNACKFTEEGTVHLSAARGPGGRGVRFAVADTGIGIKAEDMGRLFQPFVRLTADREGTGLGLHLSRRLAEVMGGRIEVESRHGVGSRFALVLEGA
jgi:PAS domain S-box-containing protein